MSRAAIIIFYKTPIQGRVKTRLQPKLTAEFSAELASLLLYETLIATRDSVTSLKLQGIETDLFLFGDHAPETKFHLTLSKFYSPYEFQYRQQVTASLGERMSRAFHEVFEKGYDAAAIFGTDSPDLPLQFRAAPILALCKDNADIAIGPTEDGGYYTLAMNRFYPSLFEGITYSASTTCEETLIQAKSLTSKVTSLQTWYDVDEIEDVIRLKKSVFSGEANREDLSMLRAWFQIQGDIE